MKKVNKSEIKTTVDNVAPKLPETTVFVASGRQIKDSSDGNPQYEFEFVQNRALAGRQTSLLALANAGDKRFNSGRTTMRSWMMINAEGCSDLFGNQIDFDAFIKAAEGTKGTDDRVAILKEVQTINVNGVKQPIKIVCLETNDVNILPKSVRENEESLTRSILQTGERDGKESELILDEYGNKVYRRYELTYGNREDVLVENKILASEFAKKAVNVKTDTKSVLEQAQSNLAE